MPFFEHSGYEKVSSCNYRLHNYNALVKIATSDILTKVMVDDKFSYVDNNGAKQPDEVMSYDQGPVSELTDPNGSTLDGTTTGEAGHMGQTLLPGQGISGKNSPDNTISIIINKNLSKAARAEIYSHETGHTRMYLQTKDRLKSGHSQNGVINKELNDMIIKSKMETVKNMQGI